MIEILKNSMKNNPQQILNHSVILFVRLVMFYLLLKEKYRITSFLVFSSNLLISNWKFDSPNSIKIRKVFHNWELCQYPEF